MDIDNVLKSKSQANKCHVQKSKLEMSVTCVEKNLYLISWNVDLDKNNSNKMEKNVVTWRSAAPLKTGQQQKHIGIKWSRQYLKNEQNDFLKAKGKVLIKGNNKIEMQLKVRKLKKINK